MNNNAQAKKVILFCLILSTQVSIAVAQNGAEQIKIKREAHSEEVDAYCTQHTKNCYAEKGTEYYKICCATDSQVPLKDKMLFVRRADFVALSANTKKVGTCSVNFSPIYSNEKKTLIKGISIQVTSEGKTRNINLSNNYFQTIFF